MASENSDPSPPGQAPQPQDAAREQALSDPKIRKVYDYWTSKCRDGALPKRSDIDAVDIYDCLSVIMMLDVVDGGSDFRIRLAGSQIEDAHDRPLKGAMVSSLGQGADMAAVLARLQRLVATRCPDFHSTSLAMVGRSFIEFDRVALPLAEDGQTVTHVLCCYAQKQRASRG
ncbi:MAG TPA: PAS domain-containing protein [Alphaproteobacteria bacterium]|jgi:hypothetical protein